MQHGSVMCLVQNKLLLVGLSYNQSPAHKHNPNMLVAVNLLLLLLAHTMLHYYYYLLLLLDLEELLASGSREILTHPE